MPGLVSLYLGCQQQRIDVVGPHGAPLGVMIYDTEAVLDQCIAKYINCHGTRPLTTAHTPSLARTEAVGPIRAASVGGWDPNWRGPTGDERDGLVPTAEQTIVQNPEVFVQGGLPTVPLM